MITVKLRDLEPGEAMTSLELKGERLLDLASIVAGLVRARAPEGTILVHVDLAVSLEVLRREPPADSPDQVVDQPA